MLLLNILLAMVWTSLVGDFRPGSFLAGFALAHLLLWLTAGGSARSRYFEKPWQLARFAAFFLWALVRANLRVAYEVITPTMRMCPGIVAIPLDVQTDAAITLLTNLVTLTPGTLGVDISADRRTLYVHAMYAHDADAVRREIKEGFERRVEALLR